HSVICSNYKGNIGFRKIFIDFIHLKYDVIRNASFGKKNIQLAWHASSNRMNAKTDLDSVLPKDTNHISDSILGFCNCETISRNNDHTLSRSYRLNSLLNIELGMSSGQFLCSSGRSSVATKNYIGQRTIHG